MHALIISVEPNILCSCVERMHAVKPDLRYPVESLIQESDYIKVMSHQLGCGPRCLIIDDGILNTIANHRQIKLKSKKLYSNKYSQQLSVLISK